MDTKQTRDYDDETQMTRTLIVPEFEVKELERDEIGIKSDLKGAEIKQCVDKAIYKLITSNMRKITLRAIGINV